MGFLNHHQGDLFNDGLWDSYLRTALFQPPRMGLGAFPRNTERKKPKKAPHPALQWSEMLHAYGKASPLQLWDLRWLLTHTLQAPSCPPGSRKPGREPLLLGKRPGAETVLQNF